MHYLEKSWFYFCMINLGKKIVHLLSVKVDYYWDISKVVGVDKLKLQI